MVFRPTNAAYADTLLTHAKQLYTFADSNRVLSSGRRLISLSYLALARETPAAPGGVRWSPWNWYFPWEDWRHSEGQAAAQSLGALLLDWARTAADPDDLPDQRHGPHPAGEHLQHERHGQQRRTPEAGRQHDRGDGVAWNAQQPGADDLGETSRRGADANAPTGGR